MTCWRLFSLILVISGLSEYAGGFKKERAVYALFFGTTTARAAFAANRLRADIAISNIIS